MSSSTSLQLRCLKMPTNYVPSISWSSHPFSCFLCFSLRFICNTVFYLYFTLCFTLPFIFIFCFSALLGVLFLSLRFITISCCIIIIFYFCVLFLRFYIWFMLLHNCILLSVIFYFLYFYFNCNNSLSVSLSYLLYNIMYRNKHHLI